MQWHNAVPAPPNRTHSLDVLQAHSRSFLLVNSKTFFSITAKNLRQLQNKIGQLPKGKKKVKYLTAPLTPQRKSFSRNLCSIFFPSTLLWSISNSLSMNHWWRYWTSQGSLFAGIGRGSFELHQRTCEPKTRWWNCQTNTRSDKG